jgi:sulfite dehydrogenase
MRRPALALAVLALAVAAAGCGSEGTTRALPETVIGTLPKAPTETLPPAASLKGNAVAGKQVFLSAGCTSCHTLMDAGSTGTIGPNLDDAKPSFDLVTERVTNGKGVMPSFKGQLSDQKIADVAAYVSHVTGGQQK